MQIAPNLTEKHEDEGGVWEQSAWIYQEKVIPSQPDKPSAIR